MNKEVMTKYDKIYEKSMSGKRLSDEELSFINKIDDAENWEQAIETIYKESQKKYFIDFKEKLNRNLGYKGTDKEDSFLEDINKAIIEAVYKNVLI